MKSKNADTDGEPLHYSELYRRAKRNVLFWAATTILVAIGTASGQDVQVENAVKGLLFASSFLTVASMTVLAFMALSYRRAEEVLIAENSGVARDARMEGQSDELDRLGAELATLEISLKALEAQASARTDTISALLAKWEDDLNSNDRFTLQSDWAPKANLSLKVFGTRALEILTETLDATVNQKAVPDVVLDRGVNQLTYEASSALEEYRREALLEAQKVGSGDRAIVLKSLNRFQAALREIRESTAQTIMESDQQVSTRVERVITLVNDLRRLSRRIRISEKRWFYGIDRAPVYGLTGIAFIVAVWRLWDPTSLATKIDVLFPHHQSPGTASSAQGSKPAPLPSPGQSSPAELPPGTPSPAGT